MQGFEKGYSRFACERELETEQKLQYFDPYSYGCQRCVFLVLLMLNSAGWWLSLLHLISIFSGPQLIRTPMAPSAWCGFPYHISSITPSDSNCHWNSNWLISVLTELYNSPTSTRSPTRSLEWHDWSSSSGNNCHAVHRSLSSGASVYECIMGFTLSHLISQIHPRYLFRLLAIGMCHFLPVHHFVMACLLGPKVKYNKGNYSFSCLTLFLRLFFFDLVLTNSYSDFMSKCLFFFWN